MTDWRLLRLAPEGTHFLLGDAVAWQRTFTQCLKFHAPGLAPVCDESGWYHIDAEGRPLHPERYAEAWGYYEGRSAVRDATGWFHLDTSAKPAYAARFAWCGNFQEGRCAAEFLGGGFAHITPQGAPAYAARYRYVGDFKDGAACVWDAARGWTHIRPGGQLLHGQWFVGGLGVFHKGMATACDAAGWHHIRPDGAPCYAARFASAEPFYNGLALVQTFAGEYLRIGPGGEARHGA